MDLKPNMIEKKLNAAEVFKVPDQAKEVELNSSKGTKYTAVVLPKLTVIVAVETTTTANEEAWHYSVFEPKSGINFTVKVPQKVTVSFGDNMILTNVQLGVVNGRTTWVKADKIEMPAKRTRATDE